MGPRIVAAGAGPTPLHITGRLYLAGPYKGAPLSFVVITPAIAGPFDLGTVVVRAALYLDPETAQTRGSSRTRSRRSCTASPLTCARSLRAQGPISP